MTTKREIMEGINHKEAKVIDNNTVEYIRPDGVRVIRLHRTDILTFPKLGGVILNSGGWKTVTTKQRMNTYQNQCTITQSKGVWYVNTSYPDKDSMVPYFDGIKIKNGVVTNPKKSAHRKEQSLLRQIKSYCDKIAKMDKLPIPDNGDCFYCAFHTNEGPSVGDSSGNTDHLVSHLKEKYVMGSLIMNALENAGYSNPAFIFQMDIRDSIVRAVRKYFKSKLGLAA